MVLASGKVIVLLSADLSLYENHQIEKAFSIDGVEASSMTELLAIFGHSYIAINAATPRLCRQLHIFKARYISIWGDTPNFQGRVITVSPSP